jgi:hypothetical protein
MLPRRDEFFDEQSAHCWANGFGLASVQAPQPAFIGLTTLVILLF